MKFRSTICFLMVILVGVSACDSPRAVEVTSPLGWEILSTPTQQNILGLSPITDEIIWACGTEGLWMRTLDGGEAWEIGTIEGLDSVNFLDIEAFDAITAIAVSAGMPAMIYKTTDGGKKWNPTFQGSSHTILNGITFINEDKGYAFGEPVEGQWLILKTFDGGDSWINLTNTPIVEDPEQAPGKGSSLFAKGAEIWFSSGGSQSQIYFSKNGGTAWEKIFVSERNGAYHLGISDLDKVGRQSLIGVGGDYSSPDNNENNVFLSSSDGQVWREPKGNPPSGFCSGVSYYPKNQWLITVGANGSDFSKNGGEHWEKFSDEVFNNVQKSHTEESIWASGSDGKIAKLKY
ncbi:YCF48-related protein [Echinicola jeungdonensis]|uniref:WD40/YVTN/BNR-like repeat-containing protein n=1 Tax=Echinicola jeungdonensis TaxID=709343 RepID=A0ABV5J6S4_9BACT|nr:YCF48-related protein [Echinicola jeungdonensis]MDN3669225.1 YCF48-related protein [Echinicola jeungdonensis]